MSLENFRLETADGMSIIDLHENIPKFITHYSRGEPFLSITSLPENKIPQIIEKLNETNAWGLSRFSDSNYLSQRIETESKLRKAFVARGGEPELE